MKQFKVRNNPQDYANRLKNDPKSFLEEENQNLLI